MLLLLTETKISLCSAAMLWHPTATEAVLIRAARALGDVQRAKTTIYPGMCSSIVKLANSFLSPTLPYSSPFKPLFTVVFPVISAY